METKIPDLIQELEKDLAKHCNDSPLKRFATCKALVRDALYRINSEIEYEPQERDTETLILYNKVYLPPLYAKLFYFDKCYRLENRRQTSSPSRWESIIEEELKTVEDFRCSHIEFSQYIDRNDDEMDDYIFTDFNDKPLRFDISPIKYVEYIDRANPGCLLYAFILAYRQYAELLQKELGNPETGLPFKKAGPKVEYKGTEEGLILLAYAKRAKGDYFIGGKPATVEYFIQKAREESGCELKNHSVVASKFKMKDGQPNLLTELNYALRDHNDKLLEGERPHKALRKKV
jgi:hypothetical protein